MVLSRIAFGSCNSQELVNNLWPVVESRRPAAFVWGGDAIYGDSPSYASGKKHHHHNLHDVLLHPQDKFESNSSSSKKAKGASKPLHQCATPGQLKEYYDAQLSHPGYRSLLSTNLTVFGTIDDHDMGCDNADGEFVYKEESGRAFVAFTGEDKNSPIYSRAARGLGVYGVKLFDFDRPEGHQLVPDIEAAIDPDVFRGPNRPAPRYSNKSVAVFVLDCRTNKTPWKEGVDKYKYDYEGDFLGETQWKWFEEALRRSRASVNIVVNGLQVHPNRVPDGNLHEAWGRYPAAQSRLYNALLQSNVQAPLLVSGDVHMAQMMRKDCIPDDDVRSTPGAPFHSIGTRSIVEVTTSGMTHSWGTNFEPWKHHHTSWYAPLTSLMSWSFMHAMHFLVPMPDLVVTPPTSSDPDVLPTKSSDLHLHENGGLDGSKTGMQYHLQKNFGELEVDWEERTVSMRIMGEDANAPPLLASRWSLDQLSGREDMPGRAMTWSDFVHANTIKAQGSVQHQADGWTCENYRGATRSTSKVMGTTLLVLFGLCLGMMPLAIFILFYRSYKSSRRWTAVSVKVVKVPSSIKSLD